MPRVMDQELVCSSCGKVKTYPECCGQSMEYDGTVFFCSICGREIKAPRCCHERMEVRRQVRDIRKEIFKKL